MTLVFREPSEGQGTHALLIGVDELDSAPFSPSHSAARMADWLLSTEIPNAPLASVELLASDTTANQGAYVNQRARRVGLLERPDLTAVLSAVKAWQNRLAQEPDGFAFFYFAGPTIEFGPNLTLVLKRSGKARNVAVDHLDFRNLWDGMAARLRCRQVYLIDGCRAHRAEPGMAGRPTLLMEPVGSRPTSPRAYYFGRTPPGRPKVAPGSLACLAQAFIELNLRSWVNAYEAVGQLDQRFQRALGRTGLPVEKLSAEVDAGGPDKNPIRASPVPSAVVEMPAGPARQPGRTPSRKKAPPEKWTEIGDDGEMREVSGATGEHVWTSQPEASLAPSDSEQATRDEPPDSPEPVPELVAAAARVARLSEGQRECLRMVYRHMETKEIARILGIGPDTVYKRIQAAMRILGVDRRRDAALILAQVEAAEPPLPPLAEADDRRSTSAPADIAAPAAEEPQPAQEPAEAPGTASTEPNTHFVSDDPEVERDELNRGPLAIALGRRLHRIWCRSNGIAVPGDEVGAASAGDSDGRSAFVLHLDAPWGGGKTSFANFLARVLNPFPAGSVAPAHFLASRGGDDDRLGTIFLDDPEARTKSGAPPEWTQDARRPWIIVPFNAWQAEHCAPPWWVFYQAIRQGCFKAVWTEGTNAADFAQAGPPRRPSLPVRLWDFARLWRRELWWRMRNPKIVALLSTFVITAAVTYALWRMDLVFSGERGPAFATGNALGFVLAGVTGISGLWGLGALLRDSVAPGTDDMAERRSLGGGDPLDRFRRHFRKMIAAVRRPVIVIVDDLDRCRPDFVVDLVRGIQTLLGSPRVVFVILGDRDWIERAFEAHHEAMSKVNVGAEQSFGARFVEKAIQMSFILPEMPDAHQDSYVRRVLLGPGAAAAGSDAPAALSERLRADYREEIAGAETTEQRKAVEDKLREKYRPVLEAAARAAAPQADGAEPEAAAAADEQAGKLIGEERALLAAVDERMGKALLHRLEPLARFFPPNPRQIKRIVNAITMYTCVAYLQLDMDEDDSRGIELAIWVIVMTEWPETWRLLASCPKLADILAAKDMKAALAALDEGELPGSRASTLGELQRIRADRALFELITSESEGRPRLGAESVAMFADLTPLYSRKRRLADDAAAPAPAPRARRRTGKAG